MSLPWNKSLRVCIGAQQVQGSLHPAWSPRRTLNHCHHSAQADAPMGASPAPFATAMTATLGELGVAPNSSVKHAQILMGDARVHFDVVQGDYAASSERQLQAVAQACVVEILGERALHCLVRWQLQNDAQHLLIAAIESADIDLAQELARSHGIEELSVMPSFCWQWNLHAKALTNKPAVFATFSDEHMVAALVVSGAITALSCGSVPEQPEEKTRAIQRKSPVDDRVDRLLASVGQDPSLMHTYLLITPHAVKHQLDARWQVVLTEPEAA